MRLELRGLDALARDPALRAAWADLLREAADPNPFYGPDFLIPLVETCGTGAAPLCALALEPGDGTAPRLCAFLPVVPRRAIPGVRPRLLAAFTHPNLVDTTPLLRRNDPAGAAEALLAALSLHAPGAMLRLPLLAEGTTRTALLAAADAGGFATGRIGGVTRAALLRPEPADARADPLSGRASGKYLNKLRRLERRLAEEGALVYQTLEGAAADEGVAAFLALEAAGWKGVEGSALASRPATAAFARAALGGEAQAPRIVVDLLRVGGAPVAANLHLVVGDRAATFKTAYDESRAKTSPGMLLHAWTARRALAGETWRVVDSCAVPGHPVEALWTDRIGIDDLLVDLAAGRDGAHAARTAARIARAEAWTRAAKARVKRLLGRRETALRPRSEDAGDA